MALDLQHHRIVLPPTTLAEEVDEAIKLLEARQRVRRGSDGTVQQHPGDVTAGELPAPTVLVAGAYVLSGLGMGLLSALFGIGGGILLVPVLIAGFGYAPQLAAGTSLAVMVPIALLGAVRLTRPGLTQWGDGARYGLGAIAGAVLGAALALAASGTLLRVAFAILMLAVGAHLTWSAVRAQPPLEEDAP